jgi:hypothetical protein
MANYWTSATQHFGEGFQTRGPLVNFLGAPHSYYSNHRKWPGACQNFLNLKRFSSRVFQLKMLVISPSLTHNICHERYKLIIFKIQLHEKKLMV